MNDAPNREPDTRKAVMVDWRILETRMGDYLVTMVCLAGGSIVPFASGGRTEPGSLEKARARLPASARGGVFRNYTPFEITFDTWPMDEIDQAAYVKTICRALERHADAP